MKFSVFHVILITFISAFPLLATDWRPIPPEQLSIKTAKVDPNADAEAIFWEAWVKDVSAGNGYVNHVVENYIRIKLYNDRAVEKYGNVEIPYYSEQKMTLSEIRARTIKPNGTIVEMPGSAIVDNVVSKSGRSKTKIKAFAMPGLEPGAIIEYQWIEVYAEYIPRYVPLDMQREIPAWTVTYNVRPFRDFGFSEEMKAYPFNCNPSPWEPVTKDVAHQGFVKTHVNNVPAMLDEPQMPAKDDVKAWMLLYYSPTSKDKPASYWPSLGRQLLGDFRKTVKVNNDIKQVAQQVTAKGNDPFEKADLLHIYCLNEIKNVSYNAEGVTSEERADFFKNLKDQHNTSDTLRLKKGTPNHIIALFYALAEAAGLNPIFVRAGSANGAIFRADFLDPYLLRNRMIGIKVGEAYRYYNPGIPYLPPGMLDWDEQSQPAILADAKEPKLVVLPASPAEASSVRRKAQLTLAEDGSLSGKVTLNYFGHFAVGEKLFFGEQSAGSREEEFKKRLESRYPGAKITNLKIENANSPLGLLKINYEIALEGYAQKTGKRLFVPVAFFQQGDKPMFSAATRRYPISFRHAFTEDDEVQITYPEGYTLDNADMPGTTNIGEVGTYSMNATVKKGEPVLTVKRVFVWGKTGNLFFEPKIYAALKTAWDGIHAANSHTLTLKVQ